MGIQDVTVLGLDAAVRSRIGGTYVTLSDGVTSYEMRSASEGAQTIVLVHGAFMPSRVWDAQFNALHEAGFNVLRYDMYGRGRSNRPAVPHDREFFLRQLVELLDALNLTAPVDMVGHSFGASLAAHCCTQHPARVRRLVLISPIFNGEGSRVAHGISRIPYLGPGLFRLRGMRALQQRVLAASKRVGIGTEECIERFFEQFQYRGFLESAVSTFKGDALRDYRAVFRSVGQQERSLMLLWGENDNVIPPGTFEQARAMLRPKVWHQFDGVGHTPGLEVPDELNKRVIDFLRAIR